MALAAIVLFVAVAVWYVLDGNFRGGFSTVPFLVLWIAAMVAIILWG